MFTVRCHFLGLAAPEDVEETDATAGHVIQVNPSFPPFPLHNVKRSTVATHFMGKILISVGRIFVVGTSGENRRFSNANYSIKHNSKVIIEDILDVDMCLS